MAQSANPFLQRLAQGPMLADGAMGTMLHGRGADLERPVEELNLTQPDWVREIHLAYVQAGAEVLQSNTFGASRTRLSEAGLAEQTRQINFRGVKLAREVREMSGQPVWVAGSIGPLGRRARHHDSTLNLEVAEAAFREQISVLWEAGADLLVFETYSDLPELLLGVRLAQETCDLPVVAEMTFGSDGNTGLGYSPAEVVQALGAAAVDVAGVNCSMGPAGVASVLTAMHDAAPGLKLSALPNAGFPYQAGDRVIYLSMPDYFAQHVRPFLAAGARLIGGCCGTTPAHIHAMRLALDRELAGGVTAAPKTRPAESPRLEDAGRLPTLPAVRASLPAWSALDLEAPEPTLLLQKIRAGKFVVSVEVDPPRGFNPAKMIEGAIIARQRAADAVNVADSPMARVRMGALALCALIQSQVGIETVLHFTTRDRSLMGLQADLIGAHALGVRNILALTGDPPNLGDQPDSKPVYDVDSVGLVHLINEFNQGNDRSGKPFGSRAGFAIAVACDPTRRDLEGEVDRFHRKVSGGAHFTMTQPVFDPLTWRCFYDLYEQRHGPFPVPVLIGILPLQSHRHASFLHNEVPGITIPAAALDRMERAGAQGRQEGTKMAQELLLQLKEMPRVQGVYLMPSFGRYEMACEVLDVLQET